MKKSILTIVLIFSLIIISNTMTSNFINVYAVECSEGEEYIEHVVAQNMNGTQTKTFAVYGRRMANGKYHYFVKLSTREFSILYADNNKYKPFYIKINGDRWYFKSTTLDLYSRKTDQW